MRHKTFTQRGQQLRKQYAARLKKLNDGGMSLRAIAKKEGVSHEHVRQLIGMLK